MKKYFVSTLMAFTALISSASAAVVEISEFRSGWYDSLVGFYHTQHNTTTGRGAPGRLMNSFYAFDLSSLAGLPGSIRNARITFKDIDGRYNSADPTETLQLNSFEGDIDELLTENMPNSALPYDKAAGIATYSDLGDGDIYGSHTVRKPDPTFFSHPIFGPNPTPFFFMDAFTINLNKLAIEDLSSALNSLDMRFALGGSLASLSDRNDVEAIFNPSGLAIGGRTFLTVEVPEPGPLALFTLSLCIVGFMHRRKKISSSC